MSPAPLSRLPQEKARMQQFAVRSEQLLLCKPTSTVA